jgi:hypothetical protein
MASQDTRSLAGKDVFKLYYVVSSNPGKFPRDGWCSSDFDTNIADNAVSCCGGVNDDCVIDRTYSKKLPIGRKGNVDNHVIDYEIGHSPK